MKHSLPILRGRGAHGDPPNRFELLHIEPGEEEVVRDVKDRPTRYFRDQSRSVLTRNRSPDVGFDWSLNPYRGCEHGCVYCYARPTHEYLGFSAGLDFESRILVKDEAPRLLLEAISRPGWSPTPLAMSGVTDPYQPVERRLRLTRRCLEVLESAGHPVAIVTKSRAVERDIDLLSSLAERQAAHVTLSITTLDRRLQRSLEPRAAPPAHRLRTLQVLAESGVPVSVNIAPVIPGLTDHEIPSILEAAADHGATGAGMVMLRLPGAVEGLFTRWLEEHVPGRAERVMARLRELHEGAIYDPRFGHRMSGSGPYATHVQRLFRVVAERRGLNRGRRHLSTSSFRRPSPAREGGSALQLDLLDAGLREATPGADGGD